MNKKQVNKKELSILIYTTNGNDNDDNIKELYYSELKECGLTEDNLSFDEWKEDYNDLTYYDMLDMLDENKINEKCVILGTLNLWDGKHQIIPKVCKTLSDAFRYCAYDMNNFEITLSNGCFHINAEHHDGTNKFDIHLLNKKGCNVKNGDFSKSCYHKKIYKF